MDTSLTKKLQAGSCTGVFCKTTDSSFIEAAGLAGLDFAILDREHGSADWKTIQEHVRAARLSGLSSIVRVESLSHHSIGAALDCGADGVQVPNISTAEQARAAVQAARFHPEGSRGVCRFVPAASFGLKDKSVYFSSENIKTLILQVEGLEGVANIDEIVAVDGFDVLFVGPYDLSQSVGTPGDITSQEVLAAIQRVSDAAEKHDKSLGVFCDSPGLLESYRSRNVPYIAYSVDVSLFRDAISALMRGEK